MAFVSLVSAANKNTKAGSRCLASAQDLYLSCISTTTPTSWPKPPMCDGQNYLCARNIKTMRHVMDLGTLSRSSTVMARHSCPIVFILSVCESWTESRTQVSLHKTPKSTLTSSTCTFYHPLPAVVEHCQRAGCPIDQGAHKKMQERGKILAKQ